MGMVTLRRTAPAPDAVLDPDAVWPWAGLASVAFGVRLESKA